MDISMPVMDGELLGISDGESLRLNGSPARYRRYLDDTGHRVRREELAKLSRWSQPQPNYDLRRLWPGIQARQSTSFRSWDRRIVSRVILSPFSEHSVVNFMQSCQARFFQITS